jgi:hypothetical protein
VRRSGANIGWGGRGWWLRVEGRRCREGSGGEGGAGAGGLQLKSMCADMMNDVTRFLHTYS